MVQAPFFERVDCVLKGYRMVRYSGGACTSIKCLTGRGKFFKEREKL